MKNRKNKLLIIAGASVHKKITDAAKSLGLYTIVVDYLEVSKSPAKQISDDHWEISITDIDDIVKKAKDANINAVLSFCIDPAQTPYCEIASKLNLPCYGTKEQFSIFTNKKKFKKYCQSYGVDVIPEYSINDIITDAVKYPILVKPSESRGSRGMSICNDKTEALEGYKQASIESGDGSVIIERYITNADDMSFAYVVIDNEPYLIKIGDRILGNKEDNLDRQQIATILPSIHTEEYVNRIEPKVKEMIKSLKMPFGAVFLQGFYENGHVYFYDPGLRFPGSDYDLALKKATGYDNMSTFVKYSITGDIKSKTGNPNNVYKLNHKKAIILSISCKPGIIKSIIGFDEISGMDIVVSGDKRKNVGDIIPNSGDINQRVLEFVALVNDDQELNKFVNTVYETIKIIDEDGKNMIVSKIKIN